MVKYAPQGPNDAPVKKTPYQASETEWAFLANFTHDLEPTNHSRRDNVRGEDWIKSTWMDCCKYLHQMYTNDYRSGQHDDDMDEWGSEKELQRWCRAANWKPKTGSQGTIIRYTSAMIYSIAVLELSDIEGIRKKMPKGTGVDATVNNGAQGARHQKKKCKVNNKGSISSHSDIIDMLREGDQKDQQLVALCIFFESGTSEEKKLARDVLFAYAFPSHQGSTAKVDLTTNVNSDDSDDESTGDDDQSSDSILERVM
jgi:hypothetical protein